MIPAITTGMRDYVFHHELCRVSRFEAPGSDLHDQVGPEGAHSCYANPRFGGAISCPHACMFTMSSNLDFFVTLTYTQTSSAMY